MSIVVLGGTGYMGAEIVRQLVKLSDVEVTIADRDPKKLEELADEIGGRINTRLVDADDFDSLVQAMRGADVAVSAIGPFYKHGVRVLKASIQAGVNFVDIDDDYDSTKESLDLDEEAKKTGITAIIGFGASPGVTNMLAKYGADKMDRAEEIRISWAQNVVSPTGRAAMSHWMHIITGDIPIFKDGKMVGVPAFSEPETVEFLSPLGKLEVRYTGHAEPVTLPRYIKGLKYAAIKGTLFPPRIIDLYTTFMEVGFGSTEDFIIKEGLSMPLAELTMRVFRALPIFAPKFFDDILVESQEKYQGCAGAFHVEVIGEKHGEKISCIYDAVGDSVTRDTAIPASLAALMILRGEVEAKGVLAPEGAVNPELFLSELSQVQKTKAYETEIRRRILV